MRKREEIKAERKEKELEKRKSINDSELGAKDTAAMLLSAFLVIFPVCVLVIVGLSLLMLWLFGAL